ncbi:MAG: PQQ-dependent sugar dehydrogenase [Ginsengibacter sp.]
MQKKFTNFLLTAIIIFITVAADAQKLALVPYTSGLNFPIDLKNCGDDRLFIAENAGIIKIANADGSLRTTPFLDISSKVDNVAEGGLLGLALGPNFKSDGKFYVYYTANVGGVVNTVLEQYNVSASDSNVADINSALTIILQPEVDQEPALGGSLIFGKDGYLYASFGFGGPDKDPNGHAQDKTTFLGKMLRLDVSNVTTIQPYKIPSSNPFFNAATPGLKKEIWALGLRNPYRNSFDRLTGDLWLPDVGQYTWEEVNFQDAKSLGGQNYGWNIMEGPACFNPPTGCDTTGLTFPFYSYHHVNNNAIIGGYVMRSPESKLLFGTYIFGDWVAKYIHGIKRLDGMLLDTVFNFLGSGDLPNRPISFGEDKYGSIYVMFGDPTIYRLSDTSYLRHPKAYITPTTQDGGTSYLLQGLQGRNLTYKWLINNAVIGGATSPDFTVSSNGNYSLVVTNSLGFSDTSDVFAFGALPLSLISFTAQKLTTAKIGLQWQTTSEQNINGYDILRKQANEINFSKIGFVQTKSLNGISNSKLDYSYIDSFALANSTIFYRLKITHIDGSISYSDVRTITSSANSGFEIYPNPASGYFQIDIIGNVQPSLLVIYDLAGRKIREQILNQSSTKIEIKGLKGVYFVQTSNADGRGMIRKKLLVK